MVKSRKGEYCLILWTGKSRSWYRTIDQALSAYGKADPPKTLVKGRKIVKTL